jgi:DNA-binding MarR family transcriptional regulator
MRTWEGRGLTDALYLGAASSIARAAEIVRLTTEEVMKPYGVSQTRHEILNLLFLAKNGELPMGKIGSRLFIHPTSVTSAVDGLERRGYVERVPHPVDRRATLTRITESGRELIRTTTPVVTARRFGLATLSEDQLRQLIDLLREVRLAYGDFDRAAAVPDEESSELDEL